MSEVVTPYNKAFTRARLQAGDDLRRNRQLSPAARLVGWEILSCVNRVSGCAFPGEEKIAERLGIAKRTVVRANKELTAVGWMEVMRHGRHNVYYPAFVHEIGANLSPIEQAASDRIGDKLDADGCQNRHAIGDKNVPLTPLSKPVRTPSTEAAADRRRSVRERRKTRQRAENEIAEVIGWDRVTEMPRDEIEDLCTRWPNVDQVELLKLKQRYEPAAIAHQRISRR